MVACLWTLTSALFVACVAGHTDSGQHTSEADQDELILLQVRTAFVPRIWQDPDTPLDPGLGLNENTPPPQEQESHLPTFDLPGWNRPDAPDPFEWPSPAECEGSSFALLNISNGQADGIFWRCTGGQTLVSLGGSCIPVEKRCDGVQHCEDGSDELHCNETSQDAPGLQPATGPQPGLGESSAAATGTVSDKLAGDGNSIANVATVAGNSSNWVTKAQQLAIPSSGSPGDDSLWSGPAVADQVEEVAATGAPTATIAATGAADVPGLPGWPAEGIRSDTAAKEYQKHLAETGLAGLGLVLAQDEVAFLQVHAVFIPRTWQDPAKPLLPGLGPSPRLETQAPPSSFEVVPSLSNWIQPVVPEPLPDSDHQNFESLPMSPAAIPAAPTDWTRPADCVGPRCPSNISSSPSSIQPHAGLHTELDTLKAENTMLQNEINAMQTKNIEWQTANAQLAENVSSLRTENVDLLTSIAGLKEDYVKLQLDLHPS